MPIALDPTQTFEIALRSDEDQPAETRPVFVYRFAAGRELRRMRSIYEQVISADADAEMPFATMDDLFDQLRERLVGWRNMIDPATQREIPFDAAEIDALITLPEAFELLARVCTQGPDREEKKRLPLPSECSTEKSAGDVAAPTPAESLQAVIAQSTADVLTAKAPTTKAIPKTAAEPVAATGESS